VCVCLHHKDDKKEIQKKALLELQKTYRMPGRGIKIARDFPYNDKTGGGVIQRDTCEASMKGLLLYLHH